MELFRYLKEITGLLNNFSIQQKAIFFNLKHNQAYCWIGKLQIMWKTEY